MQNPYQAPDPSSAPQPDNESNPGYTPVMLQRLRETRPWVRLLSILGFLMVAFMVLMAVVFMSGGTAFTEDDALAGAPGVMVGVFYLIFAGIYAVPPVYLSRYASAITQLLEQGSAQYFEDALLHQKSFWKFLGIVAIIMTFFSLLGVIFMIIGSALFVLDQQ